MSAVYGKESRDLDKRIMELAQEGLSSRVIGETLGKRDRTIASRLQRLRASGMLPPAILCRERSIRSKVANNSVKFGRRLGTMTRLMNLLTEDQIAWLYNQTPKGMCVAEIVAAMIKDIYQDEVEK